MLKIAYCGYDYYANCLSEFLARDDVQILKIYVGSDKRESCEVVRLAKEHKIPFQFKPIDEREISRLFDEAGCDYVFSAGYSYKIPIGDRRGLNMHPTLLPVGRGAWPFPRIILEGRKESGVTIHKLTDRFDAGDVVAQRRFYLDERETQDSLHCKCQMIGPELAREWLENPEELWNKAVPQGEAEYWKKPSASDRTIRFDEPWEQIDRMIRAFGSYGVYVPVGDKTWFSRTIRFEAKEHLFAPGTVIHQTPSLGLAVVAARGGTLYVAGVELTPPAFFRRVKNAVKRRGKSLARRLRNGEIFHGKR